MLTNLTYGTKSGRKHLIKKKFRSGAERVIPQVNSISKWLNDCGPALEVINDVKSSSDLKQPPVQGRNKKPTGPLCVTCDGRDMSRRLWAKRGREKMRRMGEARTDQMELVRILEGYIFLLGVITEPSSWGREGHRGAGILAEELA